MGTRIGYHIQNENGKVIAALFSNSSHNTQVPEAIFKAAHMQTVGANHLLEVLTAARYRTADGNHSEGDRIFWVVPSEDLLAGDIERLLICRPNFPNPLIEKVMYPQG